MPNVHSTTRIILRVILAVTLAWSCTLPTPGLPSDLLLPLGTAGGDGVGIIVSDTGTHVHMGCTYGDMSGRISLDANGQFEKAGTYMVRAYPITRPPAVPAVFKGKLNDSTITISVIVDDTVQHDTVTFGPSVAHYGQTPKLGPCPICARRVITRPAAQAASMLFIPLPSHLTQPRGR